VDLGQAVPTRLPGERLLLPACCKTWRQALRQELHPRGLEIVTVALDTGGVADVRAFGRAAIGVALVAQARR